MKDAVIIDTGPLVALINQRERHHVWAHQQFSSIVPPAFTCEAVIAEAAHLLRNFPKGVDSLLQLLERGHMTIPFHLTDELPAVSRLMKRYASVPMSFADACLVRMAELHTTSPVLTLDSDFRIYRKSSRAVIPTLMPK
jgi:predicted nucleic acid-binding protein